MKKYMLSENLIKGSVIELIVQEELTRYGFDISIPNYNASRYDLIVDTGKELLRIQVKKSAGRSKDSFTFACTSQNVTSHTSSKHKYTSDEIDYMATVWKNNVYLIPVKDITNKTLFTIKENDDKYLASNILSNYKRLSDGQLYNYRQTGRNYCIDCGCQIDVGAVRCISCANINKSKYIHPSRDELKRKIRIMSFVDIGKEYNVTDNTIRKLCDKYNLPRRKREINKISEEEWESL